MVYRLYRVPWLVLMWQGGPSLSGNRDRVSAGDTSFKRSVRRPAVTWIPTQRVLRPFCQKATLRLVYLHMQ